MARPKEENVWNIFEMFADSLLSRLKRLRPYPVVFSRLVFCLAGRTGDFSLTGRRMGESGIYETVGS